jgi:S-formylglutathione hydrolase FrmB
MRGMMKKIAGVPALGFVLCFGSVVARAQEAPSSRVEILDFQSKLLNSKKPLVVYLPPNFDASGQTAYPVIYYLHGLNNTAKRFADEGLPALTDKLIQDKAIEPVIIVAPTGDFSFYVNKPDGSAPYEDYINTEIPEYIETSFPIRKAREGRAIGGISMGGYGALKIGMKNPDRYCAVSAHTPFVVSRLPEPGRTDRRSQQFSRVLNGVFGNPPDMEAWKSNDPFELVRKGGFAGLAIYMNSASKDRYFLNIEANALHKTMEECDVPHTFKPIDDVHGWVSLRNEWPEIMAFHQKAFASGAAAK